MRELAGRVAVVTGAAGGIGLALAQSLAREGMKLVLSDIDAARLSEAVAALRDSGAEAAGQACDVAEPDAVERLAGFAYDAHGAVHVLCNNAGVVPAGRFRPVWDYPIEDWRWSLGVNLMGVVNGIRSFVPRMLAGGEPGHIVNTASVAGFTSGAYSPVYGAAKHAVVRVTEALHANLRERGAPIGVTLLSPGVVRTGIARSERNRPAHLRPAGGAAPETAAVASAEGGGLAPEEVAEMVVAAIREERFYLFTSDAFDEAIRDRAAAILERRDPHAPDMAALAQRDAARR